MSKKRSFFEKFTGGMRLDDEEEVAIDTEEEELVQGRSPWGEEDTEEGQLSVDVYQTPNDIVIQAMVAGVRPEELSLTITRDMVTIKGKREENKTILDDDFYVKELYWGSFSRTILLPQEIEPEEAEAIEKHGLIVIKLPKINKEKQTTLKIKSL